MTSNRKKSSDLDKFIEFIKYILSQALLLFISPIFPFLFIIIGLSLPRKTGKEQKKRDDQKIILLVLGVISLIVQIIMHYFLKRKASSIFDTWKFCKNNPTYPRCS